MELTWTSRLRRLGACWDAIEWASEYPSLEAAWAACERGDWMLWLAGRLSGPPKSESRRRLVTTACECARLSLPVWERYWEDRVAHVAIETAERWTRGEATLEEVRSAADAAASAAAAAAYTASAAAYAAYAASAAAYVAYAASAYAADAAAYTASAAAYAAYAASSVAYVAYAASASAAAYAARASVLRECADIVRRHYPEPPAIEEE